MPGSRSACLHLARRLAGRQRSLLRYTAAGLALLARRPQSSAAAEAPLPRTGDCVECLGEVDGALNACKGYSFTEGTQPFVVISQSGPRIGNFNSSSCVSTQNDDEKHFVPPWQYEGKPKAAVRQLVDSATGKAVQMPASVRRQVSTGWLTSFWAIPHEAGTKIGKGRVTPADATRFVGQLMDQHTCADGSEYLRFEFRVPEEVDTDVIDAEFIFLAGDNVVDIRAASRSTPDLLDGKLQLSLSDGLTYDRNSAKRLMESLRKQLRWEVTPVVTDFDPRFNNAKPLWFEKLYQPFLREKQNFEDN